MYAFLKQNKSIYLLNDFKLSPNFALIVLPHTFTNTLCNLLPRLFAINQFSMFKIPGHCIFLMYLYGCTLHLTFRRFFSSSLQSCFKVFFLTTDAFKQTKESFGAVDIVVNNAGIGGESDDKWESVVDVNVVSRVAHMTLGDSWVSFR